MMSGTRSLSAWWSLLLLPAGLLVGWLAGQAPAPRARPVEAQPAVAVSVPGERRVRPTTPDGGETGSQTSPSPAPEPQRNEVSQWTTIGSATAESQRNGKPILIDFNADWCPPCQHMKQEVFEDGTRGEAVQAAVIPVSIVDRTREDGSNPYEIESLQRRYQIEAFPTLIVYSPQTGRSVSTRGYGGAEETLQWIEQAARSVR